MRFHKSVRERIFRHGFWWDHYTHATKMFTYKFKSMGQVSKAVKSGAIPTKMTKEGVLTYTITYEAALNLNDRLPWKGEWRIEKDGFMPVTPKDLTKPHRTHLDMSRRTRDQP